jgi:hypothetical protein
MSFAEYDDDIAGDGTTPAGESDAACYPPANSVALEAWMNGGRARAFLLTAVVGLLAAGARPASAQNLLVNPGFTGSASGWALQNGATFDPSVDIANSATSGSARLAVTIVGLNNTDAIATQCVTPVTPGAPLTVSGNVLFTAVTSGTPGSGSGIVAAAGFSDTGCGSLLGSVIESNFPAQTNGVWQSQSVSGVVPAGAQSVLVAIGVQATTAAGDFIVNADNLDLELAAAVPTMSTMWLTLLAVGCALAVLVMQQRRVQAART